MANRTNTLALVAFAATFATAGMAEAQTVKKVHLAHAPRIVRSASIAELTAPPLIVKKRSFLDPGNVVGVGSETPEYIAASTGDRVPVYSSYAPAFFGESELPRQYELPDNDRYYPKRDLDFSPF